MVRVLSATIAVLVSIAPAIAADIHRGPVHPGWLRQSGAAVVVAPQAQTSVTIVDALGSPPLPYRGFKYPLDDASYFFPPHPAAVGASGGVGFPFAHVEWCQTRYASYRPSDNSFLPPRGHRRTCVSPFQ